MSNCSVAVIGLGYVGLPLALALSRHHTVTGYDTWKIGVTRDNGA